MDLVNFNFSLPSFEFFNEESGVGLLLDIDESHENDGEFKLTFSFPEKWHPKVETYNRWQPRLCAKVTPPAGCGPMSCQTLQSTSMAVESNTPILTSRCRIDLGEG